MYNFHSNLLKQLRVSILKELHITFLRIAALESPVLTHCTDNVNDLWNRCFREYSLRDALVREQNVL